MTPDQVKAALQKTYTLKGRILFPNLLVAKKGPKADDREKFDVQFVWKNTENTAVMAEINQFLMQMTNAVHAGLNPAALVNPFKKFETYLRQDGKPNAEHLRDCIWINPSSGKDYPPQVVKQTQMGLVNLTPNDEAEVYSGRNAAINISFYVIQPKQGVASGKRGFGLNFNAVMLLDGGEHMGGARAPVDTAAIFGGFAQDMGMPQAAQTVQHTQTQYAQQTVAQNTAPAWPPTNNTAPGNGGGFV